MLNRWLIALAILFLHSMPAHAITSYLSIGNGRGGGHLSDVTGGQDYKIQAGSGLFFSLGAILPVSPTKPHSFEGQLGLGYIFQDDTGGEADHQATWSRTFVDAIYFYRNTRELFRLGWGTTYHFDAKLSAKGRNTSAETSADNAVGYVIAAEKLISPKDSDIVAGAIGIRYTSIQYNLTKYAKYVDGNTWHLTVTVFAP